MSWRTWDSRQVVARKHHVCAACGWTIRKGHQHATWKCADGGDPPLTVHSHLVCQWLGIGVDPYGFDDEMSADQGREDWAVRCEGRIPWDQWDDPGPPEVHDWLRNLPPIEWSRP